MSPTLSAPAPPWTEIASVTARSTTVKVLAWSPAEAGTLPKPPTAEITAVTDIHRLTNRPSPIAFVP